MSVSFRVSGSVLSLARERLQSEQGTFASQGYLKYRPDATQYIPHHHHHHHHRGSEGGAPLLREVFLRVLRFSSLLKNQHFQIQIRSGTHGHVSASS